MNVPTFQASDYPSAEILAQNPCRLRDGIPIYVSTRLDYKSRRMVYYAIQHLPRLRQIHLCPQWRRSRRLYHILRIDVPWWFDIEVECDWCQARRRYDGFTESERRELRRASPEYLARFEGRFNAQRTPSPPPPQTGSGGVSRPPRTSHRAPPPYSLSLHEAIPPQPSLAAHNEPPPPYTPPVLQIAGFTGTGTIQNPIEIDSVSGEGTNNSPIDLSGL
ncbi:hypothetical protein VKT23_017674 [Stygiomarasmius scandens]|uniref:Uncharacterized protein n=1 Tax=Marasmiellus scandens TaxID=2682957 RepID=A0ABR1IUC9_9AGAR